MGLPLRSGGDERDPQTRLTAWGDLLTRTAFQLDGTCTSESAERVMLLVRRIPGVLLAELGPSGRINVSHDGAVPLRALLDALDSGGCHATIVRSATPAEPKAAEASGRPDLFSQRRLLTIEFGFCIAIVLVIAFVPNIVHRQWLLLALALPAWALYFAGLRLRRRKRSK